MSISICNVDTFVTNTVCDSDSGESHIDQEGDVGMSYIMNSNLLDPAGLTASAHLMMQIGLCDRENPRIIVQTIQTVQVILQLFREKLRHLNVADAVRRFRICDDIFTINPLVRFIDANDPSLEINVLPCESQQLAQTKTAPVKDLESVKGNRFVHDRFCERLVFFLGPEEHLTRFLLAHVAGFLRRVVGKVVELDRMIEDGAELVVDGFKVNRGVRISVIVTHLQHGVLPGNYIAGLDVAHALLFEIRKDFAFDDAFFHLPGAELDAILHVLFVELIEGFEGHFEVARIFEEEVPLPFGGLFLRLETSLELTIRLALPVGISRGDI